MAEGKFVRVNDTICPVVGEYARVNDAIVPINTNVARVNDALVQVGVGLVKLFVTEQVSDRLYGIDDDEANLDGWPVYGSGKYADPSDVACDADGNSYWACDAHVYKIAEDGTETWDYSGFGYPVLSICVDADGYVYAGDYAGVVKCFNGNLSPGDPGFEVWSTSIGVGTCNCLAIDYSEGRLYAGFSFGAQGRVYRIVSSNGNAAVAFTTSTTHGEVLGLGIDEDTPSLYLGTSNGYVLKASTAGYYYWGSGSPRGGEINCVRVGHGGYGYCVRGSERYVEKFALNDGSNEWSIRPAAGPVARSVAVDQFGHVWATFQVAGSSAHNKVRRYNSAGVEQWDWQPYLTAQMYGMAVKPGIKAAGF